MDVCPTIIANRVMELANNLSLIAFIIKPLEPLSEKSTLLA
jgi:hypothetical protein